MKPWLSRLRGLLSLSTIGGVVGGVLGVIWVLYSGLRGYSGLDPVTFFFGAGVGGVMGAFTAAVIGGTFAVFESGGKVVDLSAVRAGVAGAAGGALAPVLVALIAMAVAGVGAQGFVPVVAVCASIGGGLGVGMVATAKRAAGEEGVPSLDVPDEEALPRRLG